MIVDAFLVDVFRCIMSLAVLGVKNGKIQKMRAYNNIMTNSNNGHDKNL